MNVVNLPEEVLVLIFEYLSGGDKLNLDRTCKTFHRILYNNKRLTRKLNFVRCYTTDISSIMHFLKPEICKNVRELDLTSCYWLKPVDIRRCVFKLSNLEALYVADTSLSSSDLIKILQALHQLKRLSFSLKHVTDHGAGSLSLEMKSIALELQRLEFLLIYLKTVSFSGSDAITLYDWLSHCIGLRELWVIAPKQSGRSFCESTSGIGALHFPCLHTLVISSFFDASFRLRHLFTVILEGCMSVTSWRCFWVSITDMAFHFQWPSSSSATFESARTILESWIDRRYVPDVCPKLQHLSSSTAHLRILEPTIRKLILTSSELQVRWDYLCNSDTSLEELNLAHCLNCLNCLNSIQNIPPQKNLRKLAVPGRSFARDGCSHSVIQAVVEKFPNIEEFELTRCAGIVQPNMCSIDRLLMALQLHPVIERVCVMSSGGKLSMESVLVDFVCGASKLVFLYLQLDTLSQAACKRIQSCISKRYVLNGICV
ncbi:hypothetical protein Cfor_07581 [Coptotermes formosanus]|uniref:F-box domain-containing protein n=1 Tax=Coptotermes formosanus TaxID=36987 RepID=A0A6L2QE72_COPFO|nr:hypothetical protein Cfor_07581 [Coptotermes formosanus]